MKKIKNILLDKSYIEQMNLQTNNILTESHPLANVHDEYANDVYTILLLSVAEAIGEIDETHDNPIVYIYKIVSQLSPIPDMYEMLKRSLLLDESAFKEYFFTLQQHNLHTLVLYDALIIKELYAKNNDKICQYIDGLANIFCLGEHGLKELSLIVQTVLNQEKEFLHNFSHIELLPFLPHLRKVCEKIVVSSSDAVIFDCNEKTDANYLMKEPLIIQDKTYVYFHNALFKDKKIHLKIDNTTEVYFDNCIFENITDKNIREFSPNTHGYFEKPNDTRIMEISKIEIFSIVGCNFKNIVHNFVDYEHFSIDFMEYISDGIICFMQYIKKFLLKDSYFENCHMRTMFTHSTFAISFDIGKMGVISHDTLKDGNYSYDDFLKYSLVDTESDRLFGGQNVDEVEDENNHIQNSCSIF